ncbi:MAG: transporter substrate-binding domain-containing protein [Verrucomicrobiota bacterium]
MKPRPLFFVPLVILVVSFFMTWTLSADELTIVADPYMPYTGDPASDHPGFMIEIAKAILEKAGHTINYKQVAWDEAMSQAKNADVTAIVGASKDDLPDFIFPEIEQASAQGVFYVSTASSWKYTNVASLEKVCLGIINNYNYTDIQPYIKSNKSNSTKIRMFSDSNALEKMVDALIEGKIQAFVEDQNVMKEFLKTYPKADKIMEAGKLRVPSKLYIAFSPKRAEAQEMSKLISDGTKAMRADGSLKKILDRYNVQDW